MRNPYDVGLISPRFHQTYLDERKGPYKKSDWMGLYNNLVRLRRSQSSHENSTGHKDVVTPEDIFNALAVDVRLTSAVGNAVFVSFCDQVNYEQKHYLLEYLLPYTPKPKRNPLSLYRSTVSPTLLTNVWLEIRDEDRRDKVLLQLFKEIEIPLTYNIWGKFFQALTDQYDTTRLWKIHSTVEELTKK